MTTPPPPSRSARFVVLVPVKPPARGKSRLGLSDDVRRELAAAFAIDTAAACLRAAAVAEVLAVTDDAAFSRVLRAEGCVTIPDGLGGDLNGSLRQAASEALRRWPELQPVAICADLPALTAEDLDAALAQVGAEPAYVADADGTGTTLYAAPHGRFFPQFGPGSRLAHSALAAEVTGDLATLRRDVDDLDDLRAAQELGLGARTAVVAARLRTD